MGTPPQRLQIRDHREKDWFWSNNGVIDWYGEIVGADSIAVYMVLAKHANLGGESWPSYETIAKRLKLSRPTVIKCMKKLEACDLITKTPRNQPTKEGGTMPDSNMYVLLTVKPLDEPSKARLLGMVKEIDHPPSKGRLPPLVKDVYSPSKGALPKQDSLNKTHTTPSSGGGEARHISYLLDQNMGAAKEFADLDPDIAIRDFDNRKKAGQSSGHIVRAWRAKRPTPDDYFGKPPAQNGTGPRQPKAGTLSREALAAMARGEPHD